MDSTSIAMLVALVALVAMSGYFSATETAFTSLNRIRLKNKADNGDRRAARTLELAEDYDRLLSTILIGNNIVNNVATTIGAVLFIKLIDDRGDPDLRRGLPQEPGQGKPRGLGHDRHPPASPAGGHPDSG